MRRGPLRRSGMLPLVMVTLVAVGTLAGALAAGWGPKLGLDLEGGFAVTLQPLEAVSDDTLDQAIEIIRTRVDALGVAEPEITRQGDTIAVNLPGVTDRERARELVGQTAELRFRPVLLTLPGDATTTTTAAPGETTTTAPGETTTTAPGETTTTTSGEPSSGLTVTPREEDDPDQPVVLQERDGDTIAFTYQLGPALATGRIVEDADAELDQSGQWLVRLTVKGGDGIAAFNAAAAMCNPPSETCPSGQLAIVLDSEVVSAPTIQTPSFDREAIQITGSFTESESKDLALVLRYGSLPVALETQQSQEVSATLGNDSMRAALLAGAVGLVLVFAYMVLYYRMLGLVAMASLAVSGALLWTIISWLGETRGLSLTLAGITGIIVSIGIAVDSNVVFYEHLKEDVTRGRSARTAVTGSFTSAFSTIVKADVASLIGATILYLLTVGPVRGFAFFLGLSTVLDLVASYFFMRPLVIRMARSPKVLERPGLLGLPDVGTVPR